MVMLSRQVEREGQVARSGQIDVTALSLLECRGIIIACMEVRCMPQIDQNTNRSVLERDIAHAVQILKAGGCSEIFLFGSAASGKMHDASDLDIAVRGCPQGRFFLLLGKLMWELNCPVDLVNLDTPDPFARYLQQEGLLVRVG